MNGFRRNALALFGESTLFGLGMVFAGPTTVLPEFVSQLTGSPVYVGLVIALTEGAWRLPQILVARWLLPAPRKKPWLTRAGLVARPMYLLYALALWLGVGGNPALALALFLSMHAVKMLALSVDSVVWWDVFAKAIPSHRRGRVLGASTVVRGLLAVGAGALIARLLGDGDAASFQAYAAVFALAGAAFVLSLLSWTMVKETEEPTVPRLPWGQYLEQLKGILKHDRPYRTLLIVRLLAGFEGLALGFYVLIARQLLGFPAAYLGVFAAVQTVGGILAGVAFGTLSERIGNHRVIQTATGISATGPLVAVLFLLTGTTAAHPLGILYIWVFVAMGVFLNANFIGFANFAVELAPPGHRGTYIGLFSTFSGLVLFPPLLGGWVLERTSYVFLLCLTAAIAVTAHVVSWWLPQIRRRPPQTLGEPRPPT